MVRKGDFFFFLFFLFLIEGVSSVSRFSTTGKSLRLFVQFSMTNDHINNFVKLPSRESKIPAGEGTIFIATIALKITGACFLLKRMKSFRNTLQNKNFSRNKILGLHKYHVLFGRLNRQIMQIYIN